MVVAGRVPDETSSSSTVTDQWVNQLPGTKYSRGPVSHSDAYGSPREAPPKESWTLRQEGTSGLTVV